MSLSNILTKGLRSSTPVLAAVRRGHTIRGKAPGVAKTLEQREDEENVKDSELMARVNIGFPKLKPSRSEQLKRRLEYLKAQRSNLELEKAARSNKLLINVEQVQREHCETAGQFDLRVIADHYGVFEDLFGAAYFVPRVPISIKYEIDVATYTSVYCGNIIKPAEASKEPEVSFDASTDPITGEKNSGETFWTLIATNPDGNFTTKGAEYVHWFVANIPNGEVKKGEVHVSYLPPFPPRGIGYQRFIFVLYKQKHKLDFAPYKVAEHEGTQLEKRTFSTLDFYRKYQNYITPAGLAFYQTDWDKTLTKFYHNILKMKEPIFEYDFLAPYIADQKFFPLKQAFNLYLDRHRDQKQVNKEFLERKLQKTHPFKGCEEPLRFPNAHPLRGVPSWLKTEIRKHRLRIGRINDY